MQIIIRKLIKNIMPIGLYFLWTKIYYLLYQLKCSNGFNGKYDSFSDAINFNKKYVNGFQSKE